MIIKENEIIKLDIVDFTNDGSGVGKVELQGANKSFPIFVKKSVIGDRLLVKITKLNKKYGFGNIIKIIKPSNDRVDPSCEVFDKCGGCKLRNLDYKKQLEWKMNLVRQTIERIGGISSDKYQLNDIIEAKKIDRYRNKAQYPVGYKVDNYKKKIITGFYEEKSHNIIECNDCLIENEDNKLILNAIRKFFDDKNIKAYDEITHMGLIRHILIRNGKFIDNIMVCIVVNADKKENLPKEIFEIVDILKEFEKITSILINFNPKKTNVIMGDECFLLYGDEYIYDYIGKNKYQISSRSFFQVNPNQTFKLYNVALEYADITKDDIVWDLYCGIGTITLFIAGESKKTYGVEIVDSAIENAKENARLNNITNVKFILGSAKDVAKNLEKPDVVVVDPPRKGCDDELLETIIKSKCKRLVYISCNISTLARDIAILASHFRLEKVQPVDMFPQTMGVETVALLKRIDIDNHISLN